MNQTINTVLYTVGGMTAGVKLAFGPVKLEKISLNVPASYNRSQSELLIQIRFWGLENEDKWSIFKSANIHFDFLAHYRRVRLSCILFTVWDVKLAYVYIVVCLILLTMFLLLLLLFPWFSILFLYCSSVVQNWIINLQYLTGCNIDKIRETFIFMILLKKS